MEALHLGAKWVFRFRAYVFFLMIILFVILPLIFFVSAANTFVFTPYVYLIIFLPTILLSTLLSELYANLSYKNWKYEFTPNELKLERGIIWKIYSSIPYARVQNVDIIRGVLARIFGFSSLNIQTAGYHYAGNGGMVSEGHIPALQTDKTEELREFLMKKISKNKNFSK